MSKELVRNPYTGMNNYHYDGNGETVKVEDLINKDQPSWSENKPIDTLENSDSELFSVYDNLSEFNSTEGKSIKVEDFMNSDNR